MITKMMQIAYIKRSEVMKLMNFQRDINNILNTEHWDDKKQLE